MAGLDKMAPKTKKNVQSELIFYFRSTNLIEFMINQYFLCALEFYFINYFVKS